MSNRSAEASIKKYKYQMLEEKLSLLIVTIK